LEKVPRGKASERRLWINWQALCQGKQERGAKLTVGGAKKAGGWWTD